MTGGWFPWLVGVLAVGWVVAPFAAGQPSGPAGLLEVRVMSEFAAAAGGREILSPALVRNGWSRFHLLLTGAAGTRYRLDIAQNPEDAAQVRLRRGAEAVDLPLAGQLPETGRELFQLEFWLAADAPVRRIKLEPQVFTDASGWIVYPMEGRVVVAQIPRGAPRSRSWRELFCQDREAPPLDSVAQQEILLAETKPPAAVRDAFERALRRPVPEWCQDGKSPALAEWFLTFRDWLLK